MLTLENIMVMQGAFLLQADLQVPAGITAIVGPSGGGKSTLLSVIAGFSEPAQGAVRWQGEDLTGRDPGTRPVSVLFQDNNLFPHLNVGQNVGLALRADLRLQDADKDAVALALKRVGLQGFEGRKPAGLSGGQQSRAALARVLIADRPVVLLDEPFAALGPGLKAEMLYLVKSQLADKGRTVLMVTHDPDDAKAIADQVILVAGERAAAPVPTKEMFDNPPAALQMYLGV